MFSFLVFFSLISQLIHGNYHTMTPMNRIHSQGDYNSERISIDFDTKCLGEEDPQDEIEDLLELYPCLSQRENPNIPQYFYNKRDKMSRVYLDVSDSGVCLNNIEINMDDYCIIDVDYEKMVTISDVITSEVTDSIYYDNGVKQAVAWQLDFLDGVTDNKYNHYNGVEQVGSDRDIDIWILDTGIYADHKEFWPGQIIDEDLNFTQGHPHGTGTSACASGKNYGVAKNFYIHDYPVCQYGGSCGSADIFAGLYKVLNYLQTSKKRSVINMSLGTGVSDVNFFTNMFDEITNAGGIVVVAAGNWGDDACLHNYAYYSNIVISVGSHDNNKIRATSSSYGNCVHIYAPGVSIATAYSYSDPYITQYKSGTSFSSPITAGKIANLLHENPTLSRNEIVNILQNQNIYSISSCNIGYCYGSYHNWSNQTGNYLKYEHIRQISLSTINNQKGINTQIFVDANNIIDGLSCRVDIIHNNRSNLEIRLTSPLGKIILLNATNSYDNEPNIHNVYFPNQFDNTNMLGTWILNVYDTVGKYAGRLDYWNLKFYTRSPIQKIPTTTTNTSTCSCKGSRKCTTYIVQTDCTQNFGCSWGC